VKTITRDHTDHAIVVNAQLCCSLFSFARGRQLVGWFGEVDFLSARRYVSADNSCRFVSVCLSGSRRYCIERAAPIELFMHTRKLLPWNFSLSSRVYAVFCGFTSTFSTQFFLKISNNKGISLWNFVPNYGLRKFGNGTPIVGECDINSDSGRSNVDSTR